MLSFAWESIKVKMILSFYRVIDNMDTMLAFVVKLPSGIGKF